MHSDTLEFTAIGLVFLHRFTGWAPSRYEKIEKLEQLRVLEQGEKIVVCEAIETPGLGVDTAVRS